MKRWLALMLTLPVTLPAQPDTNGVNAAPIYWPVLSNVVAWANTHTNCLRPPASNAASPEAARAYAELRPLLAGFAPATHATRCSWGTRFEDGAAAVLPYIGPASRSARAALWAADFAASNNLPGFLDHTLDALRLSRNVGEEQLLIGYLVQISGEKPALELLTRNLGRLDDRQVARLAAALENLPPGATLIDCARMEKAMFVDQLLGRMIKAMREADTNVFELIPAAPAGGATTGETGMAGSWFARNLRLSMIEDYGSYCTIGFEAPQGESFTVSHGRPSHGIELLTADVDRGEALIARGKETALVKLKEREIVPVRLRFRPASGADANGFGQVLAMLGNEVPLADLNGLATPEGLLAALLKTGEEYEEWIAALRRLPLERFRPWQENLMKNGTVFTKLLLPAMDEAMERERDLLTTRARLEAALAARLAQRAAAER